MGIMLVLIVIAVAVIIAFYLSKKRKAEQERLEKEGVFVKRKQSFVEESVWFFTEVSFDEIIKTLNIEKFGGYKPDISYDSEHKTVLFVGTGYWKAMLKKEQNDENAHYYRFLFTEWKVGKYDLVEKADAMNVTRTVIENMFRKLDPNTEYEIHINSVKTKRKIDFF